MSETIVPIRRALLSVSDKTGLIDLARCSGRSRAPSCWPAAAPGRRWSTPASQVTEVADYTGQPEILGGRVKTLHPKIHGGILARRDVPRRPGRARARRGSSRSTWSS